MKLLIVASSSGILSYHIARLSMNLKKKGHDVIVLSGPKEQVVGLSDELTKAGILHSKSYYIDKKTIQDIYKTRNDIRRILELGCVDSIHAQGATHALAAYLAVKTLRSAERPSIVTSVHSIPNNGFLEKIEWTAMIAILNICSDMILPVSNYTKKLLIKHGLNPKKVITIYNAIDLNEFDKTTKKANIEFKILNTDPNIVCVANLTPIKGQEYYLMAAKEVLNHYSANFYVIGDGPRRKYLEEITHNLGIEKSVIFTGRIQWPEIYNLLWNTADICVSSSLSENFPFYILECMAAAKPVIATDVGGVSEAV